MGITVDCECGRSYSIAESNAGRKFKCKQCGSELQVPAEDDHVARWIDWIREARDDGETRGGLRRRLIEEGFDEDEARGLIDEALQGRVRGSMTPERQASKRRDRESGGGNEALIGIGLLLAVNALSWLFDWSFWIY